MLYINKFNWHRNILVTKLLKVVFYFTFKSEFISNWATVKTIFFLTTYHSQFHQFYSYWFLFWLKIAAFPFKKGRRITNHRAALLQSIVFVLHMTTDISWPKRKLNSSYMCPFFFFAAAEGTEEWKSLKTRTEGIMH